MAVFSLRGWDLTARIIIPLPRAPSASDRASGPRQSQQQQPRSLGKSHPEPQEGA